MGDPTIDHFTVVCSVTRLLNGGESGVGLVLIQTSLLLFFKSSCSDANGLIYMRKAERFISMQGQLQPRYHSKARLLSRQLYNGLLWMEIWGRFSILFDAH